MHPLRFWSVQRLPAFLVFVGITLLFIVSQGLFFQGFNGTDDLHYALLAHRMLQGRFSPFVLNDLFGGRALLVAIQALAYGVGGINTFTTQVASYTALVVAGYLTIFRLLHAVSPRLVLLASALFYFNPVMANITLGPAPDVFILLAAVVLLLLLKKTEGNSTNKQLTAIGAGCGLFIFSTLLIKESGLVFLPFTFISGFWLPRRKKLPFLAALIIAFSIAVAACGWVYYHYTGDFFFRVRQLQTAAYPNACNYTSFFQQEMLVRLTYGVWEEFLRQNFLPLLLATVALLQSFFSRKEKAIDWWDKMAFLILLLAGLYFPFSFGIYQPLCHKARHFLFLLPLAVIISSRWLEAGYAQPKSKWYRHLITAVLIGWSIKISNNGWNWDFYRCLLLFLLVFPFSISQKMAAATPLLFSAIIWLCLPYRFIYQPANWYPHLQNLSVRLPGKYFYFPDHDNMMHWKLFHHFDTTLHSFNLDPQPFRIFNPYYEPLRFHPGWFIVNRQYTVRSGDYLSGIDSLQRAQFFDSSIQNGPVSAYLLSDSLQFRVLQKAMEEDKQRNCNCDEPAR